MKYLLFLECDLSLNTGYSINERESVIALLKLFPDKVIVVAPRPSRPEVFHHPAIRYVYNHGRHRLFGYLRFLITSLLVIRSTVRRERVAAVVTRPGALAIVPYLLARSGVPLILKTVAAYHLAASEREASSRATRVRAWMNNKLLAYTFRKYLGGDTSSHLYVEWFSEHYKLPPHKQLALIPNGANSVLFQPASKRESQKAVGLDQFKLLVGYAGAMHDLRHLDLAIGSLQYLEDLPELGLVFIGDGPAKERLQKLAGRLGVAHRILFYASRPYAEMPKLINALDVAIDLTKVTMQIAGRERTGSFSQKIPQYLACGVPVVTWNTSDTRFIAESQLGALVSAESAQEVAAAIRSLLAADKQSASHASRLRAFFFERLSSDAIAETRFRLWQRLTSSSGEPCLAPQIAVHRQQKQERISTLVGGDQ